MDMCRAGAHGNEKIRWKKMTMNVKSWMSDDVSINQLTRQIEAVVMAEILKGQETKLLV